MVVTRTTVRLSKNQFQVVEDSIEALHYYKIDVKSVKKRLKSKLPPIYGITRDKKKYSAWGLYTNVKTCEKRKNVGIKYLRNN